MHMWLNVFICLSTCVHYFSVLEYLCVLSLPSPLVLIPWWVTPWKHLWVLRQCGSHFLLLLKPPRVRHLDVAPLVGCCFIHNPLQTGIQLRVVHHVLWVGVGSGGCAGAVLTTGSVGNKLCRDFIQNLGLGFFSSQKSQLPPAWRRLRHDGRMVGWMENWGKKKTDKKKVKIKKRRRLGKRKNKRLLNCWD